MSKLFVFDLDGVLIDSLPNMEAAWTAVKVKHEVKNPFSDYKEQIGKPFPEIMRALGLEKQHILECVWTRFRCMTEYMKP